MTIPPSVLGGVYEPQVLAHLQAHPNRLFSADHMADVVEVCPHHVRDMLEGIVGDGDAVALEHIDGVTYYGVVTAEGLRAS